MPEEELLFAGHPARVRSLRDLLPVLGGGLVVVFAAQLALLGSTSSARWAGGTGATFLVAGVGWLVLEWKRRSIHYRITTQRVVVERGILSKRIDQIDVYRITDFSLELPLAQRLVGTGNLVLESLDVSSPEVRLQGLPTDVRLLYENLRRATELERRRRGVRLIDGELHPGPI